MSHCSKSVIQPALANKAVNPLKVKVKAMATKDKKNAYKIRSKISEAIFLELRVSQGDEILRHTAVGRFDMPLLSCLANIATRAIMKEPRLDVVLKKQG